MKSKQIVSGATWVRTLVVGHGHQEVVAGGWGCQPGGRAGPGGGSVVGRGAGGGPEVARHPGARHSVADAAQARAQAQHQARTGGAARLKQNIFRRR